MGGRIHRWLSEYNVGTEAGPASNTQAEFEGQNLPCERRFFFPRAGGGHKHRDFMGEKWGRGGTDRGAGTIAPISECSGSIRMRVA